MAKILGYLISAIGAIVIALSYPTIRKALNVTLPVSLPDLYIIVVGVIVVGIGVFFLIKSGSPGKQAQEVPIFEGEGKHRKVVGYQRMHHR